MLTTELVKNIILAIVLGSLIGLQREYVRKRDKELSFAGVRTFILISLLGSLSIYLSQITTPGLFIVVTAMVILFIICAYLLESYFTKRIGSTTEFSSIITFFIGAFCALGNTYLAVFVAVATTSILAIKERLHEFVVKLNEKEIYSTLKFAIIAFIILPLLPNKAYGPYNVFNPFVIWLMVVLISGISFIAYILIKIFGTKKGLVITGFLGGLISSTAITTSFSAQSKKAMRTVNPFVFGIVIAGATMFIRVLIEVSVLNKSLLSYLAIPLGIMAAVGVLAALFVWLKKDKESEIVSDIEFSSPFRLSPALKFGLLFGAVLFISKVGQVFVGDKAIYVISLLSGLADVDAITVSMANLSRMGDISQQTAVAAITLAVSANTLFKAGIVYFMGSRKVSKQVAIIFIIMLVLGLSAAFFL